MSDPFVSQDVLAVLHLSRSQAYGLADGSAVVVRRQSWEALANLHETLRQDLANGNFPRDKAHVVQLLGMAIGGSQSFGAAGD